ncbi:MAG: HhoA/HhoB/HtrA family serine endopeptidase [Xenococcaceae cyanobacterium MO_207.B15]|nr:HhoA/HhoB/HtrA family serine endopeptidase [Xenococcaceae cyanobacterium MO_207.B15]
MNLSLNKLGVYLGVLICGTSIGFVASRYHKQQPLVVETPIYSTALPGLSIQPPALNSNQNVNFIAQAVQKVGPAVVRIDASRTLTSSLPEKFTQPFFRRFFGDGEGIQERVERGTGSGFIISEDGRLITNAHVVEGSKTVKVTLRDGQIHEGQVIGLDKITDVAVVKIDATNLPTAILGKAENLTPGEWAIAIGNPLGLDNTVTVGIISAIDRSSSQVGVPDKRVRFIQTDAAINPGNSGGPLLNAQGEVVGINTAIRADAQGLGFAIPIETAQRIAKQLFTKGKADHPYLGVHMINLSPEAKKEINLQKALEFEITEEKGVLIVKVVPNSPADQAGFQMGDTIIKVGERSVENSLQVQEEVENSEIGQILAVEVIRNGKIQTIEVRPSAFPEEEF